MLKKRIITAAILILAVVWGVFALPKLEFAIVSSLVLMLAAWEWSGLLGLKQIGWRLFYIGLLGALFVLTGFINLQFFYMRHKLNFFCKAGIGLLILVACWHGLIAVRANGPSYLLFVLVMIWLIDSAAYFVGKAWGKHKLARLISPNKTVEGALGGVSAAVIFALLISWTLPSLTILHHRYGVTVTLTLLTAMASIIGDLFESMMKRLAGVKDSGQLLPGHGGILDRIDSLIAAIPVFGLGLLIVL